MRMQAFLSLGWSPILAVVEDGARRVLEVVGWEGGSGTAPATGLYLGDTGFVVDIADATDIAGSATNYTHIQASASSLWIVNHNLGYKPGGITIKDSADDMWFPSEVVDINDDTLHLDFNGLSFGGTAYIS